MMNRFTPILSAILIALVAGVALAQAPQPKAPALFPLEDLRPGMKGTARTVFSGSEAEEFGVEILGRSSWFSRTTTVGDYRETDRSERREDGRVCRYVRFAGLHRRQDRRRDCI